MILMLLILLWNTNNKMAAPAPVQLQQPVTVSDLVCCVFVYGPGFDTGQVVNAVMKP